MHHPFHAAFLSLLAFIGIGAASIVPARAQFSFTLAALNRTASRGETVTFQGILTNSSGQPLFLNSDFGLVDNPLVLDDQAFQTQFIQPTPQPTLPSDGLPHTFDLFTVTLPTDPSLYAGLPATFNGSFRLTGGAADTDQNTLGSQDFTIAPSDTAPVVPEPGNVALLSALAVPAACLARRWKRGRAGTRQERPEKRDNTMPNRKFSRSDRLLCRVLGLLLFTLSATVSARAQLSQVTREITGSILNNPRAQYYPFSYEAKGTSIWGPGVPGSQEVAFSLPLISPAWNQKLGEFFDPCFGFLGGCEFGAGFQAGIATDVSANFHARADLGSVDLHCPGGVGIIYPNDADIHPGQPFTIQTYCLVEPTAFMNINAAHLSLKIGGKLDSKIDLAFIVEGAGHKFADENLFDLLKLPSPGISREDQLLDTGNFLANIKDIPLPIPPNFGTGLFHVPQLGARGTLSSDMLKARASDNFLTVHGDLTNLLLQYFAFGVPIKVNGSADFAGFNLEFHLLDLQLNAAAKIRQDFVFDPRPMIEFVDGTGKIQRVQAGGSVTYTAPSTGILFIKPTIIFDQNLFSDKTAVTIDPTLSFNLIKIKGGGRVLGKDLFSFNLNPFGTQTVEDSYVLPLFEQGFALPAPARFPCPPFRLLGDTVTAAGNFTALTRELTDGGGTATVTGRLSAPGLAGAFSVHVQGDSGSYDTTLTASGDGFFSFDIPDTASLGPYRPLTVSGSYVSRQRGVTIPINPVTIYWPRPALQANLFGAPAFDPARLTNGAFTAYAGTGKFALPVNSLNLEPDATLLYDAIPIPTTLVPMPNPNDGFVVSGEIPNFLMDRSGVHTLTFFNRGVNQQPVFIQNLLVSNAVPTVTDVVKRKATAGSSTFLLVRGSGFTLDTGVTINGNPLPAALISSTELQVPLADPECAAGVHPVVIGTPAPGGSVSSSYEVAAVAADIPSLVAKHGLIRHQPAITNEPEGDTVADLITLTNAGSSDLRDVTITSVKLIVRGTVFTAAGSPKTLPLLHPGEYSSAQVILPPHSSAAGDTGILQVRGTVHGRLFVLSNRVKMPAFTPPGP